VGLVVGGQGGKPAQFQPVEGVQGKLQVPGGGLKPSEQKAAYELKLKRLDTALMPFKRPIQNTFNLQPSGDIATDIDNVVTTAKEILSKPQDSLTDKERSVLPYAYQAVQLYDKIMAEDASVENLQPMMTTPQGSAMPPIPTGFRLVNP
jgi:hypothetical protein